jgi:hypothetical protein
MFTKNVFLVIAILVFGLTIVQGQTDSNGIIVPGDSLTAKLAWLQRSADSHNTYVIEVKANENIEPHTFEYRGAVNITIVLRGDNTNRIIRLRSNATMFTVKQDVTFILENNITLQGHRRESGTMVAVERGGMFIMNDGASIIGNIATSSDLYGTGVWVATNATFIMNGGTISGNTVSNGGGGVATWGIFTMNNGTISGNTASRGGGVYVGSGTFTMRGGTIEGNNSSRGGGVYRDVSGNIIMNSGTITNNTAKEFGGGVYLEPSYIGATFTKTGGIITGYSSDQNNGNVVRDDDGVLARRGHTVYFDENRRRETTAELRDNISTRENIGWDGR